MTGYRYKALHSLRFYDISRRCTLENAENSIPIKNISRRKVSLLQLLSQAVVSKIVQKISVFII